MTRVEEDDGPVLDETSLDRSGSCEGRRSTYRFTGGPLDGRVQTRAATDPAPPTVRYVRLHEGPKVVHHYDLHADRPGGLAPSGEYRCRPEHG